MRLKDQVIKFGIHHRKLNNKYRLQQNRKIVYESVNSQFFKDFLNNLDNAINQFDNLDSLSKQDQTILFEELGQYLYLDFNPQQLNKIIQIIRGKNSSKKLMDILKSRSLNDQKNILIVIVVLCSLDKVFQQEFLDLNILDFLTNSLKNEEIDNEYISIIMSCIGQLCYFNKKIQSYDQVSVLVDELIDLFEKMRKQNKDDEGLIELMSQMISIYYIHFENVKDDRKFIKFILDYYCKDDQDSVINKEVDILNFLYACTLFKKIQNCDILIKDKKVFEILVNKLKKCLTKSEEKVTQSFLICNNIMTYIQNKDIDLEFKILDDQILDNLQQKINNNFQITENVVNFIFLDLQQNQEMCNYFVYNTSILQRCLDSIYIQSGPNEKTRLIIDLLLFIILQDNFDIQKFNEKYKDLFQLLYFVGQDFQYDEIMLCNLETYDDEDFENHYCKIVQDEDQYLYLFEFLSNHKSKKVSEKFQEILEFFFETINQVI